MRKWDVVVALLTMLFGGAIIYLSKDFPKVVSNAPGPGFYPSVLGFISIFLGILLFIKVFIGSYSKEVVFFNQRIKVSYILFIATAIFAILLKLIGFIFSALLFLFVVLWILGSKNIVKNLLISIGVVLCIHVLFTIILKVPIPELEIFR